MDRDLRLIEEQHPLIHNITSWGYYLIGKRECHGTHGLPCTLCCTEQYVYCDSFYVCRKKSSTNYGVFAILRNVSLDASNRRVHYYSKMYKKNLTHKYYKCNIKRKHYFFYDKILQK